MQNQRLFLFCLLMALCFAASAQNSQSNSLTPGYSNSSSATVKHTKKKKKFFGSARDSRYKKPDVKHTARYEYYERIEKAAKEKQRILRELAKPQYSDFRYFGHKKIPKRRPPHKMRYCGECQIRH
jgi:hypothetical protein